MKSKFKLSVTLGGIWLLVSTILAVFWACAVSVWLPAFYVWWVIIGIALLPGYLVSTVFFSNLLHKKLYRYPNTCADTTVIMCALNEEKGIAKAIESIRDQDYGGSIRLLVIDNGSTDATADIVKKEAAKSCEKRKIEYIYCSDIGKRNALNLGLSMVKTEHFITVDADTFLHKSAVRRIMNHIVCKGSACVAGNLFVHNSGKSIIAKMQIYDYLLSIAAIKRFQGSYRSTLVAQGAFSAYSTQAVRGCGGGTDSVGEDIVLTYQILEKGLASGYEPTAVGFTTVPETLRGLYRQRKRWAIGMLEGFQRVKPWNQGSFYSKYMAYVNLSIIYLDLAYVFGFIPGIILALCGYYLFVGVLTLLTLVFSIIWFWSMYAFQERINIPLRNSLAGFILFLLFFQIFQSVASIDGYVTKLFGRKRKRE